jgi:hypothetical protein
MNKNREVPGTSHTGNVSVDLLRVREQWDAGLDLPADRHTPPDRVMLLSELRIRIGGKDINARVREDPLFVENIRGSETEKIHAKHLELSLIVSALNLIETELKEALEDYRTNNGISDLPCGECHLQPGECCDVCGRTNDV